MGEGSRPRDPSLPNHRTEQFQRFGCFTLQSCLWRAGIRLGRGKRKTCARPEATSDRLRALPGGLEMQSLIPTTPLSRIRGQLVRRSLSFMSLPAVGRPRKRGALHKNGSAKAEGRLREAPPSSWILTPGSFSSHPGGQDINDLADVGDC